MKITHDEITQAIASAAPQDGGAWQAAMLAKSIAGLIKTEADTAIQDKEAWRKALAEQREAAFTVRIKPTGVTGGDPDGVAAWQAAAVAKHTAEVQAKVAQNKALIASIGGAVITAGTAYMSGGLTTPALIEQLIGVGTQIADALNA